jgi:hypothetical protein
MMPSTTAPQGHEKRMKVMATITPKEFAQKVDSDGRTVRKFLRSITPKEDQPGKGSRWEIESRQVRSLTTKFRKWDEERKATDEDEVSEETTED